MSRQFCIFLSFLFAFGCQTQPLSERCPSSAGLLCSQVLKSGLRSPEERFGSRIETIRKALQDRNDSQQLADAFNTDEVRRATLQLQALGKLYERMSKNREQFEIAENFRLEIKVLEGAMGQTMRTQDLYQRTLQTSLGSAAKQAVSLQRTKAREGFIAFLNKKGWLPNPGQKLDQVFGAIKQFNFAGAAKDKRKNVKAMIEILDQTRDAMKNLDNHFDGHDFTIKDLEEGLHNLRRSLRWITTAFQSADGIYQYAPGRTDPALETKYGGSKYMVLSEPSNRPVLLDRQILLQLTKLVTDLGVLKDFKESVLDLAQLLEENGLASGKQAERQAREVIVENLGDLEIENSARALYKYYRENDPLARLRDSLRLQFESIKENEISYGDGD